MRANCQKSVNTSGIWEQPTRELDNEAQKQSSFDESSNEARGEINRALKDFNRAISLNPNYAAAYKARGVTYFKQIKLLPLEFWEQKTSLVDLALQDYNRAISSDPKDAESYRIRGSLYSWKGDHDHALEDLNQAIALDPKDVAAYIVRGNTYRDRKGELDLALQDYNQAISLSPKLALPYQSRAIAYRALGKKDLADADETKAEELSGKR